MPGYTRRQLKEDKFAETAQGAAQWASGHRQTVLWSVGLALAAILLTAGLIAWRSRQSEQANTELSAAMRTMDAQIVPAGTPSTPDSGPTFTSIADRDKAAQKQFKVIEQLSEGSEPSEPEYARSEKSIRRTVVEKQPRLPVNGIKIKSIIHDHENIDVVWVCLRRHE